MVEQTKLPHVASQKRSISSCTLDGSKHVRERLQQDGLHTGRLNKQLLDMMLTALQLFHEDRGWWAVLLTPSPHCLPCSLQRHADRLWRHLFRVFVCLYDTESLHPLRLHIFVPITPAMYRLGDRTPIHSIRAFILDCKDLAQIVCMNVSERFTMQWGTSAINTAKQTTTTKTNVGVLVSLAMCCILSSSPARIRDEHHGGRNCHAIGLIRFLFGERLQRLLPRRATVR